MIFEGVILVDLGINSLNELIFRIDKIEEGLYE
jgi:hypothetical protein